MALKHGQNAAGDHAVGIEEDGVFVPIAVLSANRLAQMVERGKDLQAKADDGDQAAQDVLDAEFSSGGSSGSKSSGKEGS